MNIADIEILARDLVDATTTSYPAAKLLINENIAYEEIVADLIARDRRLLFGDSNESALPAGTQDLVDDQRAYKDDSTLLTYDGVQIKDIDGNWYSLRPVNLKDIGPIEEYQKTKGKPTEYAKKGGFLLLFPSPDLTLVTETAGLKQLFQITADIFTSAEVTAGTKEPGFASPYHPLIAYKAALPYAMKYKKDRVAMINNEIMKFEKKMDNFYNSRERDVPNRMTTKPIKHR